MQDRSRLGGNSSSEVKMHIVGTDHSFTNEPRFIDPASGNYRLQTNSPCINAGYNGYAGGNTDLDGRPRTIAGTVDVGAYEFQGAGAGEFAAWLETYGLPGDGSVDRLDDDGDRMDNWSEWRAATIPTNAASVRSPTGAPGRAPAVLPKGERCSSMSPPMLQDVGNGSGPR